MTRMHICLFDIDGTLLNSGGAGKAALESALVEDFGLEGLRGQVAYSGRTDRAIIRDLMRLHDIMESPQELERLVTGYLRRLPECLRRHQGRVLPGIEAFLKALAGHVVALPVVVAEAAEREVVVQAEVPELEPGPLTQVARQQPHRHLLPAR